MKVAAEKARLYDEMDVQTLQRNVLDPAGEEFRTVHHRIKSTTLPEYGFALAITKIEQVVSPFLGKRQLSAVKDMVKVRTFSR